MKEIIEKEIVRRTALFQQAFDLIAPIMQVMKSYKENGAVVELRLDPPSDRTTTSVFGVMRCRSFHLGVGRRLRRYRLSITPSRGSITIWLESGWLMSQEEEAEHENNAELVWSQTYHQKDGPTIASLKTSIEEALMTDVVATRGKLVSRVI
jgi:hypothetical protein